MRFHWKFCLQAGVSIFILFLCIHYWDSFVLFLGLVLSAASPLLIGCAFAYIFNIPMNFYERHYFPKSKKPAVSKSRRPVCILLTFLSAAAAVLLLLRIVVPELSNCIILLLTSVPATLDKIADTLAESPWLSEYVQDLFNNINWEQSLSKIVSSVLGGLGSAGDYAITLVSRTISATANGMIAFIFAIYILAGKENLSRQLKTLSRRYLRTGWIAKLSHVTAVANDSFHRYIVGQCTEAVILGALCTAGMMLFRFPYAAVVGVTVGFTALIPVAGAYIGGIVGFLLILTTSPTQAVLFVVYLVILQQLEGNIIYPKVVGTSLGLPGIWVLTAVIIGGGINGIVGMLAGVPLCACLYRLIQEDVRKTPGNANPESSHTTSQS